MSCKEKSEATLFLFLATICFYTVQVCSSTSLRQWTDGINTYRVHDRDFRQGRFGQYLRKSKRGDFSELRPEPIASPGEPFPYFSFSHLAGTGGKFEQLSLPWSFGNVSTPQRLRRSYTEDGYRGDFTGFRGVQGKVLGPSFDSSPHLSKWLAWRPSVLCGDEAMTFTASGEAFTQLLVERDGATPVSLFQLAPYCDYSVRSSGSDLEMMVPYDACNITQKNGSYVLPMLLWGRPLKVSCPVQMSTPAPPLTHSSPSVLCSPHGMAVQLYGLDQDVPMLGVTVNGGLAPFVSAECAYRVYSQPEELIFFISFSNPCVMIGVDLYLQLVSKERGYTLSCPLDLWAPNVPSLPASPPLSPEDPQVPYVPDPISPASTSHPPSPQSSTQEQVAHFPDYPHYSYPGTQYPQLPKVDPPGPQQPFPPQPKPGSIPGHQPLHFLYPSGPGNLPFSSQHPSGLNHPYVPFYYPAVTPAPAPTTKKTTTAVPPAAPPPNIANPYYPQDYLQVPYDPAAPMTEAPTPPLVSPPEQPVVPQYAASPLYHPTSYGSYYPYQHFFYPKPGLDVQPPSTSHHAPPPYRFHQSYPQVPTYFPLPTPSPGKGPLHPSQELQQPPALQAICPPHAKTVCGHYPYQYYSYYQHLYPQQYNPLPQNPKTEPPVTMQTPTTIPTTTTTTTTTPTTTATTTTTTTSMASTQTLPTPQSPHLQCLTERMKVFLPFAHPDSIQLRDKKTWLFLSSVSSLCDYVIETSDSSGVLLHSPLPACHSLSRTPTTISLPLKFWDQSMEQYRTLDLQCPYQTTTPTAVTPFVSPTPPSTTKSPISPSVVPKPKVFCSSHHMTVELPPGPISGILVRDTNGNQMNLLDVPDHCRYSASTGKDGKIHLSLQLHSRCHMSVQGKMYIITVVYMTVNGGKETQFSCPVSISGSGRECTLPSEQRLPCGRGSVSKTQCLSMGCCFSRHPPACYYPIDECTFDRHFVFSVPASLTDPPISPGLLVVASNSTCKPQKFTSDYALFKIPMDGCGARRVEVGKTLIYMVEVINKVQALSLNYGTITRDSPVRLLVECRYVPGKVLTVSYLVKTPTLGPAVQTQGVFGVQLRIAKDDHYSSYYPQYHQPLQMLLGKPLYLEVRLLNTPDPNLVLLVHFCVAYPRSGKAVWVLLYNGCPNPLDPAPKQAVLSDPQTPSPQAQTHRFNISTFQFLPDGEFKDPDEEIYFMCSTEICSQHDGPCVEGCFGQ